MVNSKRLAISAAPPFSLCRNVSAASVQLVPPRPPNRVSNGVVGYAAVTIVGRSKRGSAQHSTQTRCNQQGDCHVCEAFSACAAGESIALLHGSSNQPLRIASCVCVPQNQNWLYPCECPL